MYNRLKLYALFINGENEAVLYKLICYVEAPFQAGLTDFSSHKMRVKVFIVCTTFLKTPKKIFIGGIMVSVLESSVVDRELEPR